MDIKIVNPLPPKDDNKDNNQQPRKVKEGSNTLSSIATTIKRYSPKN